MSQKVLAAGLRIFLGLLVTVGIATAFGQEPTGRSSPSPDINTLRDITGIEEMAPEASKPLWPYGLGLGEALSLGLALVVSKFRHRRSSEQPFPPPAPWALAELDRLAALAPDAGAEPDHFHTLLADVMRTYLERRYLLPASRQTTPEFLKTVQASGVLTADQQSLLQTFLDRCDLAKFARVPFTALECGLACRMGRDFVERTASGEGLSQAH